MFVYTHGRFQLFSIAVPAVPIPAFLAVPVVPIPATLGIPAVPILAVFAVLFGSSSSNSKEDCSSVVVSIPVWNQVEQ